MSFLMFKNRFLLATASILILSSSSLFGMEEGETSTQGAHTASQTRHILDPKDRPKSTNEAVHKAYCDVSSPIPRKWSLFNGRDYLNLCGIDDAKLLVRVVLDALPEEKDIYTMDIGAGNFQWGRHKAEVVNKLENLPEDLTVHIFSLRGDVGESTEEKIGRCILYNISNCKIEELSEALSQYNLKNKFHLIVSGASFYHFADPLGTFVETCKFLRRSTGLLWMDGFEMIEEKQPKNSNPIANLLIVLQATKAPFLMRHFNAFRSLNQFVLKRPDDEEFCQLPMSYVDTISMGANSLSESGVATRFRFHTPDTKTTYPKLCAMYRSMESERNSYKLYGDEELFSYFSENKLFMGPQTYGQALASLPDDDPDDIPGALESDRLSYAAQDPDSKFPTAMIFGGSNK